MKQNDTDFNKVLPQFLGISFALVFLSIWHDNQVFLFIVLSILFLLIIRAKILVTLGIMLHEIIKFLGQSITVFVLGFVYIFLITPYGFIFRFFQKDIHLKFNFKNTDNTFFIDSTTKYTRDYFERPW